MTQFPSGSGVESHRPSAADSTAHGHVRELCARFVDDLGSLHGDIEVSGAGVDIRAEFRGRTLCRMVPYRELIHVQVGDTLVWEGRVRTAADYLEAIDMILRTFMRMASR